MREMVDIDVSAFEAALEAIPNAHPGGKSKDWKDWELRLLVRYWPYKKQADVAKKFHVSVNTARNKYEEVKDNPLYWELSETLP